MKNFKFIFTFYISIFSQFNELKYDLSSKKITNSLVDSYGLEWIATEEGLNMYDGIEVHRFELIRWKEFVKF